MALKPFIEFCNNNDYGLNVAKFRYLLKREPTLEKVLRRISARGIFVDEEELASWIENKKFYSVKRRKKSAK